MQPQDLLREVLSCLQEADVCNGWKAVISSATVARMNGAILLPFALLAAAMGASICWQVWFERMPAPFQWLTRARYPRGFPIIVGFHVVLFLGLIFVGMLAALAGR